MDDLVTTLLQEVRHLRSIADEMFSNMDNHTVEELSEVLRKVDDLSRRVRRVTFRLVDSE